MRDEPRRAEGVASASDAGAPLLELCALSKSFPGREGFFFGKRERRLALRDVDLRLEAGEILGLVGESGCGKSTLARCVMGLLPADAGRVLFQGADLSAMDRSELKRLRRRVQMVFQDPYASLNPRQRIHRIVGEPLRVQGLSRGARLEARVAELLEQVGIDPALSRRHPHEFSGGQRQRIGIARALATAPELLIADEPVSALDVSVQAQILALLQDLRARFGLTLLVISHDLAVLRQICDRVAVMYLGEIVETAPAEELFGQPRHPYTRALLAAVPRLRVGSRRRAILTGDLPGAGELPAGCSFHPRCPEVQASCRIEAPPRMPLGAPRGVRCILPRLEEGSPKRDSSG